MTSNSRIDKAADTLWKEQSEENWEALAGALKGSSVKYYKVVFANEGKLSKMQDLTKSFVDLYDAKYKQVTKVPLFKKDGKRVRGATIYLTGLQVSNRAD